MKDVIRCIIYYLFILIQLAENLDGQLARMGEDLKEVISHLNTSTKSHDNKDPVYQIGKVNIYLTIRQHQKI